MTIKNPASAGLIFSGDNGLFNGFHRDRTPVVFRRCSTVGLDLDNVFLRIGFNGLGFSVGFGFKTFVGLVLVLVFLRIGFNGFGFFVGFGLDLVFLGLFVFACFRTVASL